MSIRMEREYMYAHEYEYLDFIKSTANLDITSLYGIDQRRIDLHKALLKHHGYDAEDPDVYYKSKIIMDNLDDAVDLNLTQSIANQHEASRLSHWLRCAEFKAYMDGKIARIKIGGRYLP